MQRDSYRAVVFRYCLYTFFRAADLFGAVLVPFYQFWGHVDPVMIGFTQSWFMIWLVILEVPTGLYADMFGRKRSMLLGGLFCISGFLVYGSFASIKAFFLGEFLIALGNSFYNGADQALLVDHLHSIGRPKPSATFFGRIRSVAMLGHVIAPPIGGWLASQYGLNVPMILTAIPGWCALAVGMTLPETAKKRNGNSTSSEYRGQRLSLQLVWMMVTRSSTVVKLLQGFREVTSHPKLLRITLSTLFTSSSAYFVIWLYQRVLEKLAIPVEQYGWFSSVFAFSQMLICFNFSWLEKLFGSARRYLQFCTFSLSASFLAVAFSPNIYTLGMLLLWGGAFGLTYNDFLTSYNNRHIGPESDNRATILSYLSAFRRAVIVVLNPVIGYVVKDWSLTTALIIVGVIPLLAVFVPLRDDLFEE